MRHRVYGWHLNLDKDKRASLFRGLLCQLILNKSLQTTESKAKAIKGLIDKVMVNAQKNASSSQEIVKSILAKEKVLAKLKQDIVPHLGKRVSGFSQIVRLGRRQGDRAMMVRMSLILDSSSQEAKDQKTEGLK